MTELGAGAASPRVVALGGGHGLAASLSALRQVTDRLTAVVTVADNGGSSGRLRRELGVLPPGDLRMALAALCRDDEWGRTWADVLQHRFSSDGELHNHSVGNLLVPELARALQETRARRLVTLNLGEQEGEADGFSPETHLEVLAGHAPELRIDVVLADTAHVPDTRSLRRTAESLGAELVVADIAAVGQHLRHDPALLAGLYRRLLAQGL